MGVYATFRVTLTRADGTTLAYVANGDSRESVEQCEAARYRHAFVDISVAEAM